VTAHAAFVDPVVVVVEEAVSGLVGDAPPQPKPMAAPAAAPIAPSNSRRPIFRLFIGPVRRVSTIEVSAGTGLLSAEYEWAVKWPCQPSLLQAPHLRV
jgi:hypothetical protein